MTDTFEELSTRAFKTAKARFNAAARLQLKQRSLVFSLTFITVLQICAAVAMLAKGSSGYEKFIASATITFSVFIAIISNTDSLTKDALCSYKFHECGKKLMALSREIAQSDGTTKLIDFQQKYNSLVNECNENHENIDFKLVEAEINKSSLCCYFVLHKLYAISTSVLYLVFAIALSYVTYSIVM